MPEFYVIENQRWEEKEKGKKGGEEGERGGRKEHQIRNRSRLAHTMLDV